MQLAPENCRGYGNRGRIVLGAFFVSKVGHEENFP